MTDRELLELAAKAAGIPPRVVGAYAGYYNCGEQGFHSQWNSFADDGDALRLAVSVGVRIAYDYQHELTECIYDIDGDFYDLSEKWTGDKYAATRRAITRAAAEIGSQIAAQEQEKKE